ncbi:hypothetical protein [Bifidobacterium miconisargentati]|uniref:hypothetical protein n=1 Tax=Bifidobacterium miconisargentati TaxID=2834437 RepID=UPI001F35A4E7|nr:hypothetical protein [Bifidobacterium miconisargentati]
MSNNVNGDAGDENATIMRDSADAAYAEWSGAESVSDDFEVFGSPGNETVSNGRANGAKSLSSSMSMRDGLAKRRRDTLKRCTEEAKRLDRQLLFGMTTALLL